MKTSLFIVFICLFLIAGCAGSYFTFDQARQVKVGMTRDELGNAMGKPTAISTTSTNEVWNYTYANGIGEARMVQFVLVDGKVSQVPIIPTNYDHGSAAAIQTATP